MLVKNQLNDFKLLSIGRGVDQEKLNARYYAPTNSKIKGIEEVLESNYTSFSTEENGVRRRVTGENFSFYALILGRRLDFAASSNALISGIFQKNKDKEKGEGGGKRGKRQSCNLEP